MDRCPPIEKVVDRLFEREEAVLHLIERIVAPLGLRVDGSSPWGGRATSRRFAGAYQQNLDVFRAAVFALCHFGVVPTTTR
jgi:hypothetical protein